MNAMSKMDDVVAVTNAAADKRLESLIKAHPIPTWRPFAWTIMGLLTIFVIGGFMTRLAEVTVAEGKVVPLGDLKVVQHLEGGIIQQIFIAEGDQVREGQPLIQLDVRAAGLSQDELEVQLFGAMAVAARLEAEATGGTPNFPAEILAKRPQLIEAQQAAYNARKDELDSTVNVMRNTAAQREQEVKDLTAKLQSTTRTLDLAKQRLADSESLVKRELISRFEYLKTQAEVADLQQTFNTTKGGITSGEFAVKEAQGRMREKIDAFRREANTELGKTREKIGQLREQYAQTGEKSARLEIRSPITGIVKNMRYSTVGGVVKAGEPIMEIVPTGEKLVITAHLNPIDRGFVEVGQPAEVKLSTYDYIKYGTLEGKVTRLAADAAMDPEKGPYFEVVVETDKNYLGRMEGELPITPGMVATVDIHTGTKSAIDFLIKPVIKMKAAAFEENYTEGQPNTAIETARSRRQLIQ
jgi:adhesin transport system membrane fusion protein